MQTNILLLGSDLDLIIRINPAKEVEAIWRMIVSKETGAITQKNFQSIHIFPLFRGTAQTQSPMSISFSFMTLLTGQLSSSGVILLLN